MMNETALERFVVQLEADGRSQHTIGQYRRHVRLLDRWLHTERRSRVIERIDHEDLAVFLSSPAARMRPDGTPKKATSTNALRTSLRCFFSYANAAGFTAQNPARLIRRARCGAPPPRALSKDDQRRLLMTLSKGTGFAAERDYLLVHLLLASGLRIGSALGLDVEDIDLSTREMFVRRLKGDRPDVFPLGPRIRAHLERYLAGRTDGPLFANSTGRRITPRHAARRFTMWLARVDVTTKASLHSLRHSFAEKILDQSNDVFAVMQCLGHKSVASSLRYLEGRRHRARRESMA